jgi:rhodanese-related sulfurtransferase
VRALIRAAALVVFGAAFGLAINAARGAKGVALGKAVYSRAEGGVCSAPGGGGDRSVSLDEAISLRAQAGVAFGDTRTPDDYARGHVASAVHLPCFASAAQSASSIAQLGAPRTLILYGADDAEPDAHLAADELSRRGFADVRILRGGFRAWQAANLPAESGPCEQCRKR